VTHYTAASGALSVLWLLLLLPAVGSLVLLIGGRRTDGWGHLLGCATVIVDFVLALVFFFVLKSHSDATRSVQDHLFSYIPVARFQVNLSLLLDQLSMVFVLLITGVGSLIHVYSVGYMEHDPDRRKFFAYLNLFVTAMLLLVLADNYLVLYVGWEGVGLASYLLIGFWQYKPAAATAAKKAFIANRVGDVGLSLAIMFMFATFGRVDFAGVFAGAGRLHAGTAAAICLLLLLGACGKSGQFPLQTWLPDAMEGPTPVSALIHAATMVTAGVYLICRSAPLFDVSQSARTVVTVIGAITLLYGCVVGCAYDDIKKVLAYSTVSQIGYMFLAAGLGPAGYALAILHLLAHGFFKADLFLSAGSVMHGMDDEVDMRRYGGLRSAMPVTFALFSIGYLALIGFPGLSGFFTKDKIIEAAFDKGGASGDILGTCALIGAGLTAFYMTRLMAMTFFGEPRWEPAAHPHESPKVMTLPMAALAVGSVVAGGLLVLGASLVHWLTPVLGSPPPVTHADLSKLAIELISLLAIALGIAAAWYFFGRSPVPAVAPQQVSVLTYAARRNLFADAFNEAVLMRPGQYLTRALVYVDNRGIDGAVNGVAALIGGASGRARRVQNGFVRSYALSMFAGAAVLVVALLLVRLG
jgi:NADH-quinone oxidoreductase subunit L